MGYFEKRRNPTFTSDLESRLLSGPLSPQDILNSANAKRHTVVVTIETKGDTELYDHVKKAVRDCDVVYGKDDKITVFALVPDEKSAQVVANKIDNIVAAYRTVSDTEELNYDHNQGQSTILLNTHTRVARLISESPLTVTQAEERINELSFVYPDVFNRIDVLHADVLSADDYIHFYSAEDEFYALPTRVSEDRGKEFDAAPYIGHRDFLLTTSWSSAVYNPNSKTISIKDYTGIQE